MARIVPVNRIVLPALTVSGSVSALITGTGAIALGAVTASGSGSTSSASFDYYIGPSGSDSNNGLSTSTPWAITALASKGTGTLSNKTIGIMDGSYVVSPSDSGGNNSGGIQFDADNCTLRAVNARQAVLTTYNGSTYPQHTDPILQILGNGCTLDGLRFSNSSWNFVRVTDDTTFQNCQFDDIDGARMGIGPDNTGAVFIASGLTPDLVFDNCKFFDIWNQSLTHNGSCIGPVYYAGSITVRQCSFDNAVTAMYWKADTNGPLTVQRCYFGTGITSYALNGAMSNDLVVPMTFTCTNNVFNTRDMALNAENTNNAHSENISLITKNTFLVNGSGTGYSAVGFNNDLTGSVLSGANLNQCTFKDNLIDVVGGTEPLLYFANSRNSSIQLFGDIDYNMYSTVRMRDANGTTYSTIGNWRTRLNAAGVSGQEANSIVASPTFVGSGNVATDYALASGSGKSAASDGTDIGAWGGGVTQIGCDF